jgi:Ubiquitin-protein ligase
MASNRILKELKDFQKDPLTSKTGGPDAEDTFQGQGTLMGPSYSPYAQGEGLVERSFAAMRKTL